MAGIGANYPCFQPAGKSGVVLGGLVLAELTVNLANGELWADDGVSEQISGFASGTLAMETDDMMDEVASIVYGANIKDGALVYNKNDAPPFGALAYYKTIMRQGTYYYQGYYYPRVKAALGNDSAQTRGSSVTFQTTKTTFTIFAEKSGDWRKIMTFDTPESAEAWCAEKCGIAAYHKIDVIVTGAAAGEGALPAGPSYVADGNDFALIINGTPTALYDNGIESKSSIVNGVYTLTAVSAPHDIAVVF